MENCGGCKGTGATPGSQLQTCAQCGGAGQVRAAHGFFSVTRPCPQCRGAGKIISKPCRSCTGTGQQKKKRDLSVDVPAGIDSGSRLRVSGEGEAGRGNGHRGDLYIHIDVAPHDIFKRDGINIICDYPVSFVQAAVGATVRVPTLEGGAELKVPAGTQSGTQLRLRNLGLPDLRGYRQGDQIVRIIVETPAKLTKRQKELLKEFESLSDQKTHPILQRFKDTISKST